MTKILQRGFAVVMIVIMLFTSMPVAKLDVSAAEDYRTWSQGDSRWGHLPIGANTMRSSGCLITSLAKMMIQGNIKDSSWTPASMRDWLISNNLIGTYGDLLSWAKVANISPTLTYAGQKSLQGNWSTDYNTLMNLVNQDYQIILSVKGGAAGEPAEQSSHFVIVDNKLSKANGNVYIMDTSTDLSYNTGKKPGDRYRYADRCLLYKSSATIASGEITTPTIALGRNNYYVGDKVNITWSASDKVTDFYQYWLIIKNTTTNAQCYAGATGADGDYSKNSYEFTVPAAGDYMITVYAVPRNDKDTRQKVDTEYFKANTKEMTTPTISTSKCTYIKGDTVDVSWKATAADTDFYQYWVVISDPSKKTIVNNATGAANDASKNSCSFVAADEGEYSVTVWSVPYFNKSERQKLSSATITVKNKENYSGDGHTYTSKVTKAATCSATGVKTYTCSVCKATKTETIAKTAHKYGEYKPACDFSNFPQDTQVRTCSVCKATQKATYTMKYSDSNSGVTTGSSYVKVVLDETELEDIGGVKFYLYDTETKKYVRVEDNKIEKSFDEETWSNIYKIKGLKANTEYTVLTVLYGCWDWEGEPGEKMEDDIYSVKKSTVKTLISDTLGTTSSIAATKTATSVTLNWNAVPGADGYRVYRKTNSGWLTLGHTTSLTYTENSLKANTKYTYAVKAYVLDGATKVFAPKYKTVDVTTSKATLGTTSKITATKTTSSVTLKWNKVTGATGYRVYQKTASGWKTLANTTKLTYTIKSLKAGTKYTFAIRAYVTKSGKMTLAPKYKTLDVTTTSSSAKPAQVKNLKATPTATTVKLTWSKVSGVKGYYVFSYNSKTKKYTSLGKTTGTSYTVKNCKANTAYQYAVQAYKVSGGKNVFGKVSSVVKVTTLLATPTVKISSTKGKANLTWNDIAGESGYAIYMATSKSGKYTHLANYKANSTKATKSKLTSGKTYYFKIRAYKTVNGAKTYSAYSAVQSVKIK